MTLINTVEIILKDKLKLHPVVSKELKWKVEQEKEYPENIIISATYKIPGFQKETRIILFKQGLETNKEELVEAAIQEMEWRLEYRIKKDVYGRVE